MTIHIYFLQKQHGREDPAAFPGHQAWFAAEEVMILHAAVVAADAASLELA